MKVLLKEGRSIQQHLQKRKRERTRKDPTLAQLFAKLMTKHKVKDAICLLDIGNQRDILDVNHIMSEGPDKGKSVFHILIQGVALLILILLWFSHQME